MMTESERRGSQKNRWTRWYMWLAYGGSILGVIAVVCQGRTKTVTLGCRRPAKRSRLTGQR